MAFLNTFFGRNQSCWQKFAFDLQTLIPIYVPMEKDNNIINSIDPAQKFVTPDGNKIRNFREALGIQKSDIENCFLDHGLFQIKTDKKTNKKTKTSAVSLRTYARIEKGNEDINKKYLENVAVLFTKLFKEKKGVEKYIGLQDIIKDSKIVEDPKNFKIYLDRINSADKLSEKLKLTNSIYSKKFFNCPIDFNIKSGVTVILNAINELQTNIEKASLYDDEVGFQKDLSFLDISTKVNEAITLLKSNNICLYVGVMKDIPILDIDILSEEKNHGPYNERGVEINSLIKSKASLRDYLIFNFTRCDNGLSIDLGYQSKWDYKSLQNFVRKNPYQKNLETTADYNSFMEYGEGYPNETLERRHMKNFYLSKKHLNLPLGMDKYLFNFKSSIENSKMIFEDYDEFMEAARDEVNAELESEHQDMAADSYRDMIREDQVDDKDEEF